MIKNTQFNGSLFTVIAFLFGVIGSLLLAGCGQKGALYLPEDAPSNTEFILYDNDKKNSSGEPIESGEIEDDVNLNDISEDPQDY